MKRLINKIVPMVLLFSAILSMQLTARISDDITGLESIKQDAQKFNRESQIKKVDSNPYIKRTENTINKITSLTTGEKTKVINLFKQFCSKQETRNIQQRYANLEPLNQELDRLMTKLQATPQSIPEAQTTKDKTIQNQSSGIVAGSFDIIAETETPAIVKNEAGDAEKALTIAEQVKKVAYTAAAKAKAGAYATGGAVVSGTKRAGGAVVGGARYAGESVVSGTRRAGGAVVSGAQYAGRQVKRPFAAAARAVTPYTAEDKANAETILKHLNAPQQIDELTNIIAESTKRFNDPMVVLTLQDVAQLDNTIRTKTDELSAICAQYADLQAKAGQTPSYWTQVVEKVTSRNGKLVIGGIIAMGLLRAARNNPEAIKNIGDKLSSGTQSIMDYVKPGLTAIKDKMSGAFSSVYSYVPDMSGMKQYIPTMESITSRIPSRETMVGYMPTRESITSRMPSRETVAGYMPTAESMRARATSVGQTAATYIPSKETVAGYMPTARGAATTAGLVGAGYALGGREGAVSAAMLAASGPGTAVWTALDYYAKWKNAVAIKDTAAAIYKAQFEKKFEELTPEEQNAVLTKIEQQISTLESQREAYKKIQTITPTK